MTLEKCKKISENPIFLNDYKKCKCRQEKVYLPYYIVCELVAKGKREGWPPFNKRGLKTVSRTAQCLIMI